ncbi:hypothetical protein AB670_01181 [Chryseobacterium sp. MOF25P]|uniref:hypothetical protein n=1 Tax=unclassified Chryseobacterium TaxID=2593645 RepID=UPI000805FB62|nr:MULTISPECIES: hypothetical protein [unclassified Chryseobacterium]OBW42448.1 hypothetical protein AB670_01181 [Chryseobacterium sp. MOF25P]OBW43868.1 hypothetical protein AB671_04059 [Chryseobacterium sp. BGARF1]
MNIPENFTEFLHWIKKETEKTWSGDFCKKWIQGAQWIGMTNNQINEVEKKYSIQFTPEHREFLEILHTIDRKEIIENKDEWGDEITEYPFFYNWLEDHEEIKEKLNWPYETILRDVVGRNGVWLKSWGKKPDSEEEKTKIFTDWYNHSPTLLPLTSHRFIISNSNLKYKPILSIWGSDIIIYGWSLRTYLLNELNYHLDIWTEEYDEEDQQSYSVLNEEAKKIHDDDYKFDRNKKIPYWEELILLWNTGWKSFGLEFPGQTDSPVYPIMKTYIPDDSESNQKVFNDFKNP